MFIGFWVTGYLCGVFYRVRALWLFIVWLSVPSNVHPRDSREIRRKYVPRYAQTNVKKAAVWRNRKSNEITLR